MGPVVCAGDRFIGFDALAEAVTHRLGEAEVRAWDSPWPDVPFRDVDGVREAAGDPRELAALVPGAEVVLTHLAPVTASVLAAGTDLRVVGVTRGGPVNVDLAAATGAGVPVLYLPGRNLNAVAEFVIGVIIASCRGVAPSSRQLADGQWDGGWFRRDRNGPELAACTVGLVGLGAIGSRVARLLGAFGSRVLATDPFADPAAAQAAGVRLVELPELLAQSDVVSLHARLTPETRHLFGAETLARMRPGARLVNTARGELVDRSALLDALERGHLGGVALDVFDPEPPAPDDPLLRRPDVLATPHLAGASQQVAIESVRRIVDAVATYLQDGTAEHCANPEVLSR